MGWYFRKSVSFGGLRFNFSKGGVGVSTGVRGLRFGVNSRGQQYVHCGGGGIYYHKTFGTSHRATPRGSLGVYASPNLQSPSLVATGPNQLFESGDVTRMTDASAVDLLSEIRLRHRRLRFHRWSVALAVAIFVVGTCRHSSALEVVAAALFVVATPLLWFADQHRKQIARTYNLDKTYAEKYRRLHSAFDLLRSSQSVWLVDAHAAVYNGKYHGGASALLTRRPLRPRFGLPPYFRSNVTAPMLPAGRQTLYFFPDTILVYDGERVGAINYADLNVTPTTVQFIEHGTQPTDSQQVGQTWQYVNKSGGPDRRFVNNRSIPVMLYGEFRLQSATGLNEHFQTSCGVVPQAIADALKEMRTATAVPAVAPSSQWWRTQ
jgi:hypothetical protein